jgi:hypothetical protein
MKKPDWADKTAAKLTRQMLDSLCAGVEEEPEEDDKAIYTYWLARALRNAARRGARAKNSTPVIQCAHCGHVCL